MSQSHLISSFFNPVLSGWETDALRQPTRRGRAKSKAEPQELCKQRREREISLSSLRSSGLNLHNQPDAPCNCGIPEETKNHPKIEAVDVGSNCRLGVWFLHLICFCFYVYLSLVFRPYYHWWICLLVWLVSSFFFNYFFIFSFLIIYFYFNNFIFSFFLFFPPFSSELCG